ncbi:MAG: hypothetical protein JW818_13595 [Pirellulales bacterium]|nr:hypothetical protein [Pirellulales bacterium]
MMNDSDHRPDKQTANQTAIRYIFYWSFGIAIALGIDIWRRGLEPTNGIPMAVVLAVLVISGMTYFLRTTASERRRDVARKLRDPFHE